MSIKEIVSNLVIPKEWYGVIENSVIEPLSGGKSGMRIYKLVDTHNSKSYVLKLADNIRGINELKYEVEILNELQDKEFAPNIYYTKFTPSSGFSLREYIDGKPIDDCGLALDEVLVICTHLLKEIHNINISHPLMKTYTTRLEDAKYNIRNGLVDVEDFEDEFKGYSADTLYELFSELECVLDTDTFTHGDFNFPNIIYNGSKAVLIDWGSASMSDPYQDISLLIREFRDIVDLNDQKHLLTIIANTYDIDHIEDDKVRKFILLDEFF